MENDGVASPEEIAQRKYFFEMGEEWGFVGGLLFSLSMVFVAYSFNLIHF